MVPWGKFSLGIFCPLEFYYTGVGALLRPAKDVRAAMKHIFAAPDKPKLSLWFI